MAFTPPLHVGKPAPLDWDELARWQLAIKVGDRFTNDGPVVQAFEARVVEEAGTQYAVATSSGTAALGVLFKASGCDSAGICTFTFPGVVGAFPPDNFSLGDAHPEHHGLTPPDYLRSDYFFLDQHLWGRLHGEREKGGLDFFDAAHAFGSRLGGRRCGSFGKASILSFHATKIVTTGEGGAVVTNDQGLAQACRELRNFGFASPTKEPVFDSDVARWGTNAKMSEFAAAVGLTSLKALPAALEINAACRRAYEQALTGVDGVSLLPMHKGANLHYLVVEVPVGRDALMTDLHAEGVLARRYFQGLHHLKAWKGNVADFPVSDRLSATLLCLPTGPAVGEENCRKVGEMVAKWAEDRA